MNTIRSTGIFFQENNLFNPGREKGSNMKWRCSQGSGSVVREKSIKKGETVKDQRKEKMKKKKYHEPSDGLG